MAENGDEKLIAAALQVAKTIGPNDATSDEILKIFDGRLRERLAQEDPRGGSTALLQALNPLQRQISQYLSLDRPIWSKSADSSCFLDAIDQLIVVIRDWTPFAGEESTASCLDRAEYLLQQAMFRLEQEFRTIFERGSQSFDLNNPEYISSDEDDDDEIPVAQPMKDYDLVLDLLPAGTTRDLNEIAKRMVVAGYGKECSRGYISCRREFLEESFSRLGMPKFSIEELQNMQWAQLEDEMDKWIKGITVALRILFPSERRLCDRIFHGFSTAADTCFMEICKGSSIHLLDFADAVAMGSRAPDRLFKVLDVYETVMDLMPQVELIFSDQYCLPLLNEFVTIWRRLGDLIRETFVELENLIRNDPAKTEFPGGGLHPITRYVMNYLRAACRSRRTLEHVFEETGDNSSLGSHMAWSMKLLMSNLEAKSKVYKDPSLCSLFLMNNLSYILQKAKDSELGTHFGDDWIRKRTVKVSQYLSGYQKNSWGKVLDVLKMDNNSMPPNEASKTWREKLKLFNSWFEEICRIQSTWVFYDEMLREELRISVTEALSVAYQNFIGRNERVKQERYVRYRVEDIENRLSELFPRSGSGRT
ncbi:hypothetical protein F511_00251 [Dorcoceras hygrometricum]|nr:hypothetical protein F511_00251 [Dorcoceras hygrometricum]